MKLVLTHGVFDLLHVGHIRHLEQARSFGDKLIVSVVPDRFVSKRHVIYNELDRIVMLKALRFVDDAILCESPGPECLIKALRPSIYVRGWDYIDKHMPESDLLEKLGIEVRCTEPSLYSTTTVIERIQGQR